MKLSKIGPFALVLFFLAVALILTYPLLLNMSAGVIGAPGSPDYLGHVWHSWWFGEAIATGVNPYEAGYSLFPFGSSDFMAKSGPCLNALLAVPFSWLGWTFSINLTVIALLTFNGIGAFVLVRYLTGSTAGALVSGIAMMLIPSLRGELGTGHMDQLSLGWVLLYLYFLIRSGREAGYLNPVLAAFFLLMSTLSFLGYGLLLSVMTVLFAAHRAFRNRNLRDNFLYARRVLVFGLTASMLLAPVAVSYLSTSSSTETSRELKSESRSRDIDKKITDMNSVSLVRKNQGRAGLAVECWWTIVVLAGLGIVLAGRAARVWVYTAVLFFVLALGPAVEIGEGVWLMSPGNLFYEYWPFFHRLRFPFRLMLFFWMAVSVLAGYGVAELGRRMTRLPAGLLVPGAIVVLVVEAMLMAPVRIPAEISSFPSVPAWYHELGQQPGGAIIGVPFLTRKPTMEEEGRWPVVFWGALDMYYQTVHGRPTMSGRWTAVSPPDEYSGQVLGNTLVSNLSRLQTTPESELEDVTKEDLLALSALGYELIIVNENWLWPGPRRAVGRYLDQNLGEALKVQEDGLLIYTLPIQ